VSDVAPVPGNPPLIREATEANMPDLRLLSTEHDLVVRSRDEHGLRVVSVSGEADLQTEHRLSRALRDVVPGPGGAIVLDLTGLTFCSAYAMGVLVDMVGSIVHRGFDVAVVGLPAITARVWLLTDVPIPTQYASVDQAISAMSARLERAVNQADSEQSTARLLAELDGLRRALATRAIIEQAKGMLMERLTCTSEEAFNLIVLQSQRSGRKLHDIAAGYLRSTPETPAIPASLPLAGFPVHSGTVREPPDPESAA
jgi:anti-anti-sigma factor